MPDRPARAPAAPQPDSADSPPLPRPKPAAHKLTAASVAALPTLAARYAVADTALPGLEVRVTPAGGKSFAVRYRPKGSRTLVRMTLGDYPTLLPDDARARARQVRAHGARRRGPGGAAPGAESGRGGRPHRGPARRALPRCVGGPPTARHRGAVPSTAGGAHRPGAGREGGRGGRAGRRGRAPHGPRHGAEPAPHDGQPVRAAPVPRCSGSRSATARGRGAPIPLPTYRGTPSSGASGTWTGRSCGRSWAPWTAPSATAPTRAGAPRPAPRAATAKTPPPDRR
jgi:hypothetical protein